MRAKGRPRSRLQVALALAAGPTLCLFLLLGLLHRAQDLAEDARATPAKQEPSKTRTSSRKPRDEFVWSSEIRAWTLADAATRDLSVATGHPQEVEKCIWPGGGESAPSDDRIINQLLLSEPQRPGDRLLKIAVARDFSQPLGQEVFLRDECRVNKCALTNDLNEADAIVWPNSDVPVEVDRRRRANQIWIAYLLESPPNTFDKRFRRRHRGRHEFNWTASYRSDSDIVTPYAKFVPYFRSATSRIDRRDRQQVERFYERASEKHKQLVRGKRGARVAWLVSNCNAHNERLKFARELGQFIQVDIYGKCGNLTCTKANHSDCLAHLNLNYKFYLSFENSNNREYITEKLYRNAYGYNDRDHLLLPIVMGPSRRDYERSTPPESFVHVDDFETTEQLARYLTALNNDHALYYSYFHWKTLGRFIDTKFLCRICAMMHNRPGGASKSYANIEKWWLEEENE